MQLPVEKEHTLVTGHGKVQNKRLIQQSKYNEVLIKNKAIPEVGTTQQQMRKQYDEKLSENQIAKLLSNKHFICDTDLSSNHFRHSRNRLHKKNLSLKGSACDQTNSNEESFQVKEETLKEANLKIESLFTTRSFSIQIMPCYKHQIQKRQEKSTNSNK